MCEIACCTCRCGRRGSQALKASPVCRMVPEQRVRTCSYKVCRMVPEEQVRTCTSKVCKMVREECSREGPCCE